MGIMDMFRTAPAAPAAVASAATAATVADATGTPKPGEPGAQPQLGADGKPVSTIKQDTSPLAEFADFWQTPVDSKGQPVVDSTADPLQILPNLSIDPAKLQASAAKIDFAKAMNPEKVKLALSGDQAAFSEVMNSVAQQGFAAASSTTARIVDAALRNMVPRLLNEVVPGIVQKHSVADRVAADVPIFSEQAVKPLLDAFLVQFRAKNPGADTAATVAAAQKYTTGLAKMIQASVDAAAASTPEGKRAAAARAGTQDQDFSDFLMDAGQDQR